MKKFNPKKNASPEETPILLRLGRRHTLDVGKEAEDKNIRKSASRTASVDSLDQLKFSQRALNPTENVAFAVNANQKPRKHFSSASTIVITESELSASWLYKNRRDAAEKNNKAFDDKPLDNERPTFSSPELDPEIQNLEPGILQDPKMKPVVVPLSRREKFSSCCCYFLIAVIICLCSLGIISAIGGIVYMELFTTYNETHLLTQTQSPNLSPFGSDDYLKASQETPSTNQVNDLTEDELSVTEPEEQNVWNIYRILMPRSRNGKALNKDSFSRNHQNSDSKGKTGNDAFTSLRGFLTRLIGESLRNGLNETEEAGVARNDRQSKNEYEGSSSNNSKSDLLNEAEGSSYPFEEKGDFKSDDHAGIKENLVSVLGSLPEATKASNDFAFDRRSGFIKMLNKSELRAVEEMSHSLKNYVGDLQMTEKPNVQQNVEVYSVDINSPEKGMSSKHFNESITADLYYDMNHKSFVLPTENVIPVVTPAGVLIHEADKYKEHMKDLSSKSDNRDAKSSFQRDKLTGPVLEINIPLPSELLKRLKLEIESTTPSVPLNPLRPTDIKSSLAEVLKHLQILDKNNKLPSSRKKNFNSSGTKPFSSSKSHETRRQDVAIERSLYLQKLRTIMFDK